MATSLSTAEIARELADYGVALPEPHLRKISSYLELLLRWNRRVNLTAIREPRQAVRRLFGESLYLAEVLDLKGWLVDVGSGAGFPGLALKLAVPELRVTVVESRKRKCAFLKEVTRSCRLSNVDVVDERFEIWTAQVREGERPSFITTRAVNVRKKLLATMRGFLDQGGRAAFVTTPPLAGDIQKAGADWKWQPQHRIPHSNSSVVLVGMPLY